MRTAAGFVNTSADDCRISLQYCTANDLPMIKEALSSCWELQKKTHVTHLERRIKQLER